MSQITRWGIVGPGNIAHKFASGLKEIERAQLYAVVSRTLEKAEKFGAEYGVEHCYGNYEDFLGNDQIDAVYIATPHPFHKKFSIMCMEAGKAVLCEKPVAMNQVELKEMIDCARRNNVFFMEAVWTRFLPITVKLRELLAEGVIGEIKRVAADFSFNAPNKVGRLYEPELGGGGLLDVGIYSINYATMILGNKPNVISSVAYIGETNVDERASITLGYENGVMADLYCGISITTVHTATIYGAEGTITIDSFWQAKKLVIAYYDDREDVTIELDHRGNGYCYEAEAVGRLLEESVKESPVMPLGDSMAVMQIMDQLRADWGLKYPME